MNRDSLRPLTMLLVICFVFVSVICQAQSPGLVSTSHYLSYSQKSESQAKNLVQFLFEEKEGEKGSEKHAALFAEEQANAAHTFVNPFLSKLQGFLPAPSITAIPLYISYRRLLV